MKHSIEKPGDFERKAKKWLKLAIEYMVKPKTIKVKDGYIKLTTKRR